MQQEKSPAWLDSLSECLAACENGAETQQQAACSAHGDLGEVEHADVCGTLKIIHRESSLQKISMCRRLMSVRAADPQGISEDSRRAIADIDKTMRLQDVRFQAATKAVKLVATGEFDEALRIMTQFSIPGPELPDACNAKLQELLERAEQEVESRLKRADQIARQHEAELMAMLAGKEAAPAANDDQAREKTRKKKQKRQRQKIQAAAAAAAAAVAAESSSSLIVSTHDVDSDGPGADSCVTLQEQSGHVLQTLVDGSAAEHNDEQPVNARVSITDAAEAELDAQLKRLGYWRKRVPKDGSCFFRVAADMVCLAQSMHLWLRNKIADSMSERRCEYEGFVVDEDNPEKESR
jgi:hypothetical protein